MFIFKTIITTLFLIRKEWKTCSIIKECLIVWDIKWPIKYPIINVYVMTLESAFDIC